jgi:hypothetical protein
MVLLNSAEEAWAPTEGHRPKACDKLPPIPGGECETCVCQTPRVRVDPTNATLRAMVVTVRVGASYSVILVCVSMTRLRWMPQTRLLAGAVSNTGRVGVQLRSSSAKRSGSAESFYLFSCTLMVALHQVRLFTRTHRCRLRIHAM